MIRRRRSTHSAGRFAPEDLTISPDSFTCLAVETATELPGVALIRGDAAHVRQAPGLRTPSRSVFEWTRELLDEAGVALEDVDCIAFGSGPGSFTGVRVAVALAQSLGYARGLPLCPVSTLAALAAGALRDARTEVAACCLDAHMGEVYVGVYRRDAEEGVVPVVADSLGPPGSVTLPESGPMTAVGPGWLQHPDLATRFAARFVDVDGARLPLAVDVAQLALPRFRAGQVVAAVDAEPNYLRHQVAIVPKSTVAERNAG